MNEILKVQWLWDWSSDHFFPVVLYNVPQMQLRVIMVEDSDKYAPGIWIYAIL